MRCKTK